MPGWCPFAIVFGEIGKPVDITCFLGIHPSHRGLEIGFTWVGEAFQGTAGNPGAKYLLFTHAFDDLA
jgi:N-acetyltransferase